MYVYVGRGDGRNIGVCNGEGSRGREGGGGLLHYYISYMSYICYRCYIRYKIVIYLKSKNKSVKFLKLLLKAKWQNFSIIIYLSISPSILLPEYIMCKHNILGETIYILLYSRQYIQDNIFKTYKDHAKH